MLIIQFWLAAFHLVEMLYDTLYLTEPQHDWLPAETERNEQIRQRHAGGGLMRGLAQD